MTQLSNNNYVSMKECEDMIAKAIDKHNKTASVISASLGSVLLFFYAHGVMCIVDRLT